MSSRQYLYIMIAVFALAAVISFVWYKKKGKSVFVLFPALTALILRLDYVLYTPHWVRQHDVIGFGNYEGQAAYIEWFMKEKRLPDFDPTSRWGFFQPPLHHIISAAWISLQTFFGKNYGRACENVQYLTLLYSLLILFFAYLIFRQAGLEGESLIAAFALTAIHPGFILLAGSINNDCLCELLMVMSFYYTIRWYRDSTCKNIIPIALCVGLSMFTKLSGALAAPSVAFIFLVKWISGKKEGFWSYLKQYVVFALICVPLGLFYPIRNLIKYGVSVNYTPPVGEPVYTTDLFSRIFDIRTDSPFVKMIPNGDSYNEFNMPLAILKTSLFGETDLAVNEARMLPFAWAALILGALLALMAFAATVCVVAKAVRTKKNLTENIFWGISYLIPVVFLVNLCISIPYFSSQDFRYIQYVIVTEALFTGLFLKEKEKLRRPVSALILFFGISVTAVYVLLGKP